MTLETLLLLIAKIGLLLLVLIFPLRWLLVLWLWLKYDRPLKRLAEELETYLMDAQETARGRGVTTVGLTAVTAGKERELNGKMKKLEEGRRRFLDRANLAVSLSALGK